MSRNRQPANDEPAQPTQPRPVNATGHALAEDGLPISGPARARALQERAAAPAPQPAQPQPDQPEEA